MKYDTFKTEQYLLEDIVDFDAEEFVDAIFE